MPHIQKSNSSAQMIGVEESNYLSQSPQGTAVNSLRKISSAQFSKVVTTKQSKTSLYHPNGSQANSRSQSQKSVWRPCASKCNLFDAEPFSSVIHPAKFEQTPFHKFKARVLHKETVQDFKRHIGKLNRPITIMNNQYYDEAPPRTFYNHLKAEFDFFKNAKANDSKQREVSNLDATKALTARVQETRTAEYLPLRVKPKATVSQKTPQQGFRLRRNPTRAQTSATQTSLLVAD